MCCNVSLTKLPDNAEGGRPVKLRQKGLHLLQAFPEISVWFQPQGCHFDQHSVNPGIYHSLQEPGLRPQPQVPQRDQPQAAAHLSQYRVVCYYTREAKTLTLFAISEHDWLAAFLQCQWRLNTALRHIRNASLCLPLHHLILLVLNRSTEKQS